MIEEPIRSEDGRFLPMAEGGRRRNIMVKGFNQTSDDFIPLPKAKELIANQVYPKDNLKIAKNKANGLIVTAETNSAFKRKYISNEAYLPKKQFEHWAARKWPKFFAVSFDLPQYLYHTQRAPTNRKPNRVISRPIPVFDPNSVRVPVEFDKLKRLYLQAKQDLIYMKWRLSNCEDELEEFREHDAAFRKASSDWGKEGGRGRKKL